MRQKLVNSEITAQKSLVKPQTRLSINGTPTANPRSQGRNSYRHSDRPIQRDKGCWLRALATALQVTAKSVVGGQSPVKCNPLCSGAQWCVSRDAHCLASLQGGSTPYINEKRFWSYKPISYFKYVTTKYACKCQNLLKSEYVWGLGCTSHSPLIAWVEADFWHEFL